MSLGRVLLVSLAVLAVGFGMWRYWWTALDHFPEQDACSFGTVSNDRYRSLLVDARQRIAKGEEPWSPLHDTKDQQHNHSVFAYPNFANQLRQRLDELSTGMTSLDEIRAAAHAVMRASGGILLDDGEDVSVQFPHGIPPSNVTGEWAPWMFFRATYALHANRLGEFSPQLLPYTLYYITLNGAPLSGRAPNVLGGEFGRFGASFLQQGIVNTLFSVHATRGFPILRATSRQPCPRPIDSRLQRIFSDKRAPSASER